MLHRNPLRRNLIMGACAIVWFTCLASATVQETSEYFKPLGSIPTNFKDSFFYVSPDSVYRPAELLKSEKTCLKARSVAYAKLRNWQKTMHSALGQTYRNSEKQYDKEYDSIKDPKQHKPLAEWQAKLTEAFAKMNQQIDQEYQDAIKQVHFKIPCSGNPGK